MASPAPPPAPAPELLTTSAPNARSSPSPTPPPPAVERKLTLAQKIDMCAKVKKILVQRDLQPYALGWGTHGLSLSNPIRSFSVSVVNSELFEAASLGIILANCAMLAIYDPLDFEDTGPRNRAIAQSEDVFQVRRKRRARREKYLGARATGRAHAESGSCPLLIVERPSSPVLRMAGAARAPCSCAVAVVSWP
jgi:hypothetical protein